jgi:type II secretory pathway predicted ATPase ExeA
MYEEFFHLHHRPFAAAPQVERYYPSSAMEQARKTICRCIERAEGAALIIGSSGTGKSLLCQILARQFSARYQTAVLTCGHLGSRRALLQAILFELGQPYRGMDEGELRLSLVDHLVENSRDTSGLVLFVDEAHTLPWRLLEELRLITNLTAGGQPRIRIVLAGNGTLEEHFANPKLDSFSQRVAARCYLGSLDRAETVAYVRHQLAMSGGNPDAIIAPDALESVHRATDGIPRLINQVCDHALILASLADKTIVQRTTVEEAWADLQQLPAPWASGAPTGSSAGSSVVEFGSLDDAADDLSESIGDEEGDPLDDENGEEMGEDAGENAGDETPNALPFHRARAIKPADLETQLSTIDGHLAQYEEDFRPAGSIGPEVELVFADHGNPFQEDFAEEEVIIDRYAAIDTGSFAGLPSVSSAEGRVLGAHLAAAARPLEPAPATRETEPRTAAKETNAAIQSKAASDAIPAAASTSDSKRNNIAANSSSVVYSTLPVSEPASTFRMAVPTAASPAAPAPAPTGTPLSPRDAGPSLRSSAPLRDVGLTLSDARAESVDDLEDRDLIIIEDDAPLPPLPPRNKPLVRRQEYRQLFAKLRRG